MPVHTPKSVYRAWEVDGVPDSGAHKPKKAEIIQLLEQIQTAGSAPAVVRETLADLELITPVEEAYGGQVLNDPAPANNGYYFREDGDWVKGRGFPDTAAELVELEGSANAVTAGVETGVNPADIKVWFIEPLLANTGNVTLNGLPIRNVNGTELGVGEWPAGRLILLVNRTTEWRLLSDPDADAAAAAASASALASLNSAVAASDDADRAEAAADEAVLIVGFDAAIFTRRNLLNAGLAAKAIGSAQSIPDGWTNGFGGTDGIDAVNSSGYQIDLGTKVAQVGAPIPASVPIAGGAGTPIGNLSANGSLAQAFDGVTNKGFATSPYSDVDQGSAFIGKNFTGAPKVITKVTCYGPNNNGFVSTNNPSMTLTLFGRNGTAPANQSDGTALADPIVFNDTANESAGRAIVSTSAAAWDYVWVRMVRTASSDRLMMAQVVFEEAGFTAPPDGIIRSVVKAADFNPSFVTVSLEVIPVDAMTLNTDLVIRASRTGGAAFVTGVATQRHTMGSARFVDARIDVSGQAAGSSICTELRFLNDKQAKVVVYAETWSAS